MQIGAIIGLFVALLWIIFDYNRGQQLARRMNQTGLYRGRAVYHVSRGKVIIICLLGITGGAIVGWLVS